MPPSTRPDQFPLPDPPDCSCPANMCTNCQTLHQELADKVPAADLAYRWPTYPYFFHHEFDAKADHALAKRIAGNMSARLSKHFGRPIRCYEALVTEGRKVTAYFLVDFLEVIIPDEVLYERMFGGYGVPIDGWRAWMGGRDPCRRRLLFFRGRLDPGRFDLGTGC